MAKKHKHNLDAEFLKAVQATALNYAKICDTGLAPPEPNQEHYQAKYTAWQQKVGETAAQAVTDRNYRNRIALDSRRLAAQQAATKKILTKIQSGYQAQIQTLQNQVRNAQNATKNQKLQSQIDALKAQSAAAAATHKAVTKDPSSTKSLALQAALIKAAQNKPADLTGMFQQMLQQQKLNPGGFGAFEAAPGLDTSIPSSAPSPADDNAPDTSGSEEVIVLSGNGDGQDDPQADGQPPQGGPGGRMNLDGFDDLLSVSSFTEQTGDTLDSEDDDNDDGEKHLDGTSPVFQY